MNNNKICLNGFGLITYNLHNGDLNFKELIIKNLNKTEQKNETKKIKKLILKIPKKDQYEYWVIKGYLKRSDGKEDFNYNKFKLMIIQKNQELTQNIYIKVGPFATLEDGQKALKILSEWDSDFV